MRKKCRFQDLICREWFSAVDRGCIDSVKRRNCVWVGTRQFADAINLLKDPLQGRKQHFNKLHRIQQPSSDMIGPRSGIDQSGGCYVGQLRWYTVMAECWFNDVPTSATLAHLSANVQALSGKRGGRIPEPNHVLLIYVMNTFSVFVFVIVLQGVLHLRMQSCHVNRLGPIEANILFCK